MKINSLGGLRRETERLEYKIQSDRSRLKTEFQLLRFQILGYAFRELLNLFRKPGAPKEKKSKSGKSRPAEK